MWRYFSGQITLVGENPDAGGGGDVLLCLDASGDLEWSQILIGSDTSSITRTTDLDVSEDGEVAIVGVAGDELEIGSERPPPVGPADLFVARFDPDGQVREFRRFGNPDHSVFAVVAVTHALMTG